MRHFWSLENVHFQNTWLTIGSFDGVHLGHQAIVSQLSAGARPQGSLAVVLTFYPHPAIVLGKRKDPFYLTTSEERAAMLGKAGADVVITYPFDLRVAATSAADFIAGLHEHLGMTRLLIGPDFALGKNREGNLPVLRRLGERFGFAVEVVHPVEIDGEPVSSSRVRAALAEGDVELAERLLGRPYRLSGKVVQGDGRGRVIGVPTANLEVWAARAIPRSGVYVCRTLVNGQAWGSVTNVGVRPTFDPQAVASHVETHILDFEGELYGERIQVDFLACLREEKRFPSVHALVAQINQDIAQARQRLAT